MPRFLQRLTAPLMNEEAGAAGGGTVPTEAPADLLAEHGLNAEEFAALSDADREALLADTLDDTTPVETDEEAERLRIAAEAERAAKAKPTQTPAEAEANDDGSDPADEPAAAPAAAPAPAPAAPAPAVSTPPSTPPVPAPVAVEITDADILALPEIAAPKPWRPVFTDTLKTEREQAQAKLDTLEDQFAEGEITKEEWQAAKRPLQTRVVELDAMRAADIMREQDAKDAVEQSFNAAIHASFEQVAKLGLDYRLPENADKVKELDAALVRFAQAAPLMHPGKTAAWYDRWALNRAHEQVGAKYGIRFTAASAPLPPAPAPATPGRRPAPDLSQLPPTTRGAPPAADANVRAGEFAHLEGLSPVDLEKAVARMTPEQQERYLAD